MSKILAYRVSKSAFTLYADGDNPFVILTAIHGISASNLSNGFADFGCFMPPPAADIGLINKILLIFWYRKNFMKIIYGTLISKFVDVCKEKGFS